MALDVGELVARLTVDDTRFTRGLQQSEQRLQDLGRTARTEAGRVDTALRDAGQGADRLGTNAQNARRDLGRVGDTSRDIDRVGTSSRDAARQVDQIGESARRASQETGRIGEGVRERLTGAFQGVGDLAGRTGESGGGSFLAAFASKIGSLSGKGGPIAGSLLGVTALGVAAGAVLANAIADGMEQEAARNDVQAKLNLDDKTAAKIGRASGAAYAKNFGESVQANMASTVALFDFKLLDASSTENEIQAAIEKTETLNSLLGTETAETLRGVGGLVNSGLVDGFDEAGDFITRARTIGMNAQGDLVDSLSEYSAGWKNTGLTAETTLALINQSMGKGFGADNTDRAADALREFGRRITEEGDTIVATLNDIGLDGQSMYEIFKKGGPEADAAFDKTFDTIRNLEDQTKKNNAAAALLGDTSGDFYSALANWDVTTAVQKFDKLEGSMQTASDTFGKGTAASFETAKRSIVTSADEIELALAQAFGPAMTDAATWVTEHKPEIIAFFTGLADAGFAALDATMAFSSGALRAWAFFAEGVGGTIGTVVQQLAGLVDAQASVLDLIPGMGGQADDFRDIADGMRGFADSVGTAGDKARGMADVIDAGRPVIQGMRDSVAEAGAQAEESARLMQALGTTVVEGIPDDKSITISDNSPETVKNLEALGLKVENTPNGIKVTATTDEADRILDAYINQQRSVNVDVKVRALAAAENEASRLAAATTNEALERSGGYVHYADGGVENHQAQIGDGRTRIWNEPETGGEAYIPLAGSKRQRSEAILGDVAKRFGFGLLKFANGGVVESAGIGKGGLDASMSWARSMDPATYLMGGFSTDSIDCSGAVSGAINKALGLDAFDSRMSTVNEGSWLQARGAILGKGPEGTIRVGWYDNGGGANGHTAMTYPDGTNFESNGSEGVVVGGDTGWDAGMFDQHAWFPMSGDLGQSSSGSGAGSTGSADSGTVTGTTDSGVSVSTDGQRVFVTNWPGSSSSSTGTSTGAPADPKSDTIFSAAIKYRANGGIDNLPDQAGIQHGTVYRYGEPETGGEAFIPLGSSKRPRSLSLTRQVANRFGYELVPMADGGLGGFGGYRGNSDRPSLDIPLTAGGLAGMTANQRRAALYNLGAIGVGGAFAVASGFDADGRFTGQFDTGANSHPALEKAAGQFLEVLSQIRDAAQEGKTVNVQVDVDQGAGMANIAIMKNGL
ncbi:hypothetical protein JWS13_17645 [Rhodococcus pseudokoreensis]|uniref:Phage tail tape measure protein domain-containing protein n=1 Tax=Rhodococcus pseudokoreensis TaxID=2811421 RepID=A0A974W2U7_9NOCA|nr:phage tail tape measure protein [Rhodococcus pseudokoreensis]QSE90313.1 hypothetical protein JWS13_17645 [Rhodococcus pseudokoreensis]